MPILNVQVSGSPRPELSREIASGLSELTAKILHKSPERTAILIDYLPREQWFVSGRTLAEQNKDSFSLEIKVVDGTNTKDEKAEYISQTFALFSRLLGDLHAESYIHVHDVRADAYGFGGQTQEYRYIQSVSR